MLWNESETLGSITKVAGFYTNHGFLAHYTPKTPIPCRGPAAPDAFSACCADKASDSIDHACKNAAAGRRRPACIGGQARAFEEIALRRTG